MKPKWNLVVIRGSMILAILVFALSACAQSASPSRQEPRELPVAALPLAPEMGKSTGGSLPGAPVQEAEDQAYLSNQASSQPAERIVIKNANLTIIVADPSKSMTAISKMAEGMGGFVVTANMYKEKLSSGIEAPRASITVRVPAEKLNQALDQIRTESKQDPVSENLSSQDVTNEYVDLQSRLKNLEAAEVELTKIMQEAYKTEDVMAVYNQLIQIREQIEVLKGQIKYYSESARFSAVSVELIADAAVQPLEIGGWKPEGIAKEAIQSMIKTMQFLTNALIWIILYLLPVILVLFVIFVLPPFLLIRAWRRRRARRKAQQAPPETPA